MASMRDIKRRKSSIQSTQQITKAMKLVSTVKLQRAKANAERSKAYFQSMFQTVNSILARTTGLDHPYLRAGESPRKAVIVITSNRGLAGGYNSNVTKLVAKSGFDKEDLLIYAVGRKGKETLQRGGYRIEEDWSDIVEEPAYPDAMKLGTRLLEKFSAGEIGEIYLAYTQFKNTVSHEPVLVRLLPVEVSEEEAKDTSGGNGLSGEDGGAEGKKAQAIMNFEPEDEEALNRIIPKYINSQIYGGLVESVASENGARMQAMDSATSNAEEMIGDLTLLYNRARQGSITQELTEIIAGAEAIS